jgi:hypothetical protein
MELSYGHFVGEPMPRVAIALDNRLSTAACRSSRKQTARSARRGVHVHEEEYHETRIEVDVDGGRPGSCIRACRERGVRGWRLQEPECHNQRDDGNDACNDPRYDEQHEEWHDDEHGPNV